MESHNMWLSFLPGSSDLVSCFQNSSTLQHVLILYSFLWPNNFPLYDSPTFRYSFISEWTFRLLPVFGYEEKHCCRDPMGTRARVDMPSLCLGKYLGQELLGAMGTLCLTFSGAARRFSDPTAPFTVPAAGKQAPVSPPPYPHLLLPVFLIVTVLVGVECCLIAVLICISLMANDVEHLSCSYCPFAYFLYRNVCSESLPIFNWVVLLFSCNSSFCSLDTHSFKIIKIYDFKTFFSFSRFFHFFSF